MLATVARPCAASIALFMLAACSAAPGAPPAASPPGAATTSAPAAGHGHGGYQKPPQSVLDVLHAPLPPSASLSPTHDTLILATPVRYPPIADLAEPMLRLAGSRVVPRNRSLQGVPYWSEYVMVRVPDGAETRVALPPGARVSLPRWSVDGKRFVFEVFGASAVELWAGEAGSPAVRRLGEVRLNPMLGDELRWMPDQKALLVKLVPPGQGPAPARPAEPPGPNVQETSGQKAASSTYEVRDVLKSPHDEDLFDHYAASQIALVDFASGEVTSLGPPALYAEVSAAPDGEHLLVESIHRPYSYLTAHERFPREVEVWDRAGKVQRRLASVPLADSVPVWGVRTGPRHFAWRPTDPATLTWAEALDGGDWNRKVPQRDRVLMLKAPFAAPPVEIARTEQRFEGLLWGERPDFALLREDDVIRHRARTFIVNVDDRAASPRLLWDLSNQEHYQHPGFPDMRPLPSGYWVVAQDGDAIYLSSVGSSPEGDRPFLDRLDVKTLRTERLFRSDRASFESFVAWLDLPSRQMITRHESPTDPPNFFVRTVGARIVDGQPGAQPVGGGEAAFASTARAITHLPDPAPAVRGIKKRLVRYKRADGVDLSFTLYLPPGYQEGTRLPTIVWAYPLDYADAKVAGQVTGSPQRFTVLGWPLQLFFLLQGYAVVDNPSLPVVGDANKIYDTYMEQLLMGAKAAVDKAVELGVADPDRIGVTGHSHGGLMTVNLLAHSDLFRAGIARSGAYNRSLTAFGFQNERRSLWEAPDVYLKVSPFFAADKVKSPLLLIHGEADVNPGTVPLQSEKLFEAIRGTGGTARLVMLPFESHGYTAMESTEHVLYEMLSWFDRYVKNAPPRSPPAAKP